MENASKALLIAGGVLLTMLVVSLLVFAWGRFSEFYNIQDELKDVDDVTEFNLQFTGYQNRNVHGYELISLANKVADYNMRYSSAEGAKNSEKYTPITMTIDIKGKTNLFNFGEVNSEGKRIALNRQTSYFIKYENVIMTQSKIRNDIEAIITDAIGIEKFYSGSNTTSKLAKSIGSLILSDDQISNSKFTEEELKKIRVDQYKAIINSKEDLTYNQMVQRLTDPKYSILKYYEYVQFKKSIFECTNLEFDAKSNRVSKIDFIFRKVE